MAFLLLHPFLHILISSHVPLRENLPVFSVNSNSRLNPAKIAKSTRKLLPAFEMKIHRAICSVQSGKTMPFLNGAAFSSRVLHCCETRLCFFQNSRAFVSLIEIPAISTSSIRRLIPAVPFWPS